MNRHVPPPPGCDVAVVGGGIVGLAVARELQLREPDARVCLLEAEDDLAGHQSSHNSGVVHAGVYYEPGSLRARLCVEGAARLADYCAERELPWRASGKLIVATREEELPRLDELERRARANGVDELRRLGPEGIREIEPAAGGLSALHSPATAVTDFARIARAFADDFESSGGTVHLGSAVIGARPPASAARSGEPAPGLTALRTRSGNVVASRAVFCAGLQSDRLAVACGGSPEPRIVPIRGGYLRVRPERRSIVHGNLYPVPDPHLPFLGAHLTRTFGGELLIGPTAMIAGARDAYRFSRVRPRDVLDTASWPGTWRLMRRHWRATAREATHSLLPARLALEAARLAPALSAADVLPGPAGVRAQALGRDGRLIDDFLIEETEAGIHVRNAPSPAATSSLALATLIADRVLKKP